MILLGNILTINIGGYLVNIYGMPNILPILGIVGVLGACITAYAIFTHKSPQQLKKYKQYVVVDELSTTHASEDIIPALD